jgi:hypothetical protein
MKRFSFQGDLEMVKRAKSKDFKATYDKMWQEGPSVKYSNPEHAFRHVYSEGRTNRVT